jgi:hypothetical protein
MSKRHHVRRRKSYGRRQHELHERGARPVDEHPVAAAWTAGPDEPRASDRFAMFDPTGPRLRFALGE